MKSAKKAKEKYLLHCCLLMLVWALTREEPNGNCEAKLRLHNIYKTRPGRGFFRNRGNGPFVRTTSYYVLVVTLLLWLSVSPTRFFEKIIMDYYLNLLICLRFQNCCQLCGLRS